MKRLINLPGFKKWLPAAIIAVYLLPLIIVNGAVDMFLKIEGIDGESKDAAHKDWIDVSSMTHGVSRSITGAGSTRSVGEAKFTDLTVTKWIDKSSPILMLGTCQGRVFPKVEFDVRSSDEIAGQTKYMNYVLHDVVISSVSPTGSAGADPQPAESLSLNFTKIEINYTETDDASGQATYNTNVTCTVGNQ